MIWPQWVYRLVSKRDDECVLLFITHMLFNLLYYVLHNDNFLLQETILKTYDYLMIARNTHANVAL